MKFSICEEFLDVDNFHRLRLLDFPVELFIAAPSLSRFRELEGHIKHEYKNVESVGYWPVLRKEEGYWMSGFSVSDGLDRIMDELRENGAIKNGNEKLRVLWDAELPIMKKDLLVTSFKKLRENREKINDFLARESKSGLRIMQTRHPRVLIPDKLQSYFGINFDSPDIQQAIMFYTSIKDTIPIIPRAILNPATRGLYHLEVKRGVRMYGDRFCIGIGCLANGIFGPELSMPDSDFSHDIEVAQEEGVKTVLIYRLGGIDAQKAGIMRQFYN